MHVNYYARSREITQMGVKLLKTLTGRELIVFNLFFLGRGKAPSSDPTPKFLKIHKSLSEQHMRICYYATAHRTTSTAMLVNKRLVKLETVSIAEPLQNRQHAPLMLSTLHTHKYSGIGGQLNSGFSAHLPLWGSLGHHVGRTQGHYMRGQYSHFYGGHTGHLVLASLATV